MSELVAVALITAFASLGASALIPWVREAVTRRRDVAVKREEARQVLAAEAIATHIAAVVQRAKLDTGRSDVVEFAEHMAREGRVIWGLQAFDQHHGHALANMMGTAFLFARKARDEGDTLGHVMNALRPWSHGEVTGTESFELYCNDVGLPAEDPDEFAEAVRSRLVGLPGGG